MLRCALRSAPRAAWPRAAPARRMGGGGSHPPAPGHVWTPAGGWFAAPPQWQRNTVYAFLALGAGFLYVGAKSASLEERPVAPKHAIPSALWSSGVKPVDDAYKSDAHVE